MGTSSIKHYLTNYLKEVLGRESVEDLRWHDDFPKEYYKNNIKDKTQATHIKKLKVVEIKHSSKHYKRFKLEGENLRAFATKGYHVKLFFPRYVNHKYQEIPMPEISSSGRPVWKRELHSNFRVYTILKIETNHKKNADHIFVDMYLHHDEKLEYSFDKGLGEHFARNAEVGDELIMMGPGGGIPPSTEYVLLLGDETALPAIERHLLTLNRHQKVNAFIELSDLISDMRYLKSDAEMSIQWLPADKRNPSTQILKSFKKHKTLLTNKQASIYVGCEKNVAIEIRQQIKSLNLQKHNSIIGAYWSKDKII